MRNVTDPVSRDRRPAGPAAGVGAPRPARRDADDAWRRRVINSNRLVGPAAGQSQVIRLIWMWSATMYSPVARPNVPGPDPDPRNGCSAEPAPAGECQQPPKHVSADTLDADQIQAPLPRRGAAVWPSPGRREGPSRGASRFRRQPARRKTAIKCVLPVTPAELIAQQHRV